jgi:glycerate-2-kinase
VELLAVEVNVYDVPFAKPVIVQLVAGETTVHVAPPGDAVTV